MSHFETSAEYNVTLPKGKYTIKLYVRHDSKALLDKLKGLEIAVDFALAKDVACSVYTSLPAAITSGTKYTGGLCQKGARTVLYVAPPTDKAPGQKPGDVLVGVLKLADHKQEVPLLARVPKDEETEDEAKDKDDKSDEELLAEAVRDAMVSHLKTLREDSKKADAFNKLARDLKQSHPNHIPLLKEILSKHDVDGADGDDAAKTLERCLGAVKAADAIIDAANVLELAAHYGVKHDTSDPEEKKLCKKMDTRKEALIEALLVKGERLAELFADAPSKELKDGIKCDFKGKSAIDELHSTWQQIQQWVVIKDQKIETQVKAGLILSAHERRHGRPGAAVAEILRIAKSKEGAPNKRIVAELRKIATQMGWKHLDYAYDDLTFKLFPSSFPLN